MSVSLKEDRSGKRLYGLAARVPAIATLVGASVYLLVHSVRWPMMLDAQVMHYVNFLMDHGFAPYREIGDMNMPGAYWMERFAMVVFGPGDMAFRIYDFFLMGVMIAGMIAIAWPYDWLAGLFPGVLFALIHAADGPRGTGQRDEAMAVLMVVGLAFLFQAVRSRRAGWMALAGVFFGLAIAVKPTVAPLGLALLGLVAWVLRQDRRRVLAFVGCGLLGGAVPAALFAWFMAHFQAWDAFVHLNRTVTAYYSQMNRLGFLNLLRECMPRPMRLLVPFGLAAAAMNRDWKNWERWALGLGVAFSALSYFVQGKGFYYQRYPLIAFTLLWFSIELSIAMRRPGAIRWFATAGMALGIFGLVPLFAARARTVFYSNIFTETLESDLNSMGVDRLQRNVQCLDMVDGCMNALYHLRIVQQTGLTGDNLLFPPDASYAAVSEVRKNFWDGVVDHPPDVFVLSDEKFLDDASFDKLDRWPLFRDYLAEHYTIYRARRFNISVAYGIYVRRESVWGRQR